MYISVLDRWRELKAEIGPQQAATLVLCEVIAEAAGFLADLKDHFIQINPHEYFGPSTVVEPATPPEDPAPEPETPAETTVRVVVNPPTVTVNVPHGDSTGTMFGVGESAAVGQS